MREIKFRAWEKHAKRMAEVTAFKWKSDHLYHQIYTRAIVNQKMIDEWYAYDFGGDSNGIILMQYTGNNDKKDVEIYENDIVEDEYNRKYVVVFKGDCWRCEPLSKGLKNRWISNHLMVIGSIYENPELLEGTENE